MGVGTFQADEEADPESLEEFLVLACLALVSAPCSLGKGNDLGMEHDPGKAESVLGILVVVPVADSPG